MIFCGWRPLKVAIGAYLFSFLQVMGIYFQTWMPSIPAQVFQVEPFPLIILALLLMALAQKEFIGHITAGKPWLRQLLKFFSGRAPSALGKPFRLESVRQWRIDR